MKVCYATNGLEDTDFYAIEDQYKLLNFIEEENKKKDLLKWQIKFKEIKEQKNERQ